MGQNPNHRLPFFFILKTKRPRLLISLAIFERFIAVVTLLTPDNSISHKMLASNQLLLYNQPSATVFHSMTLEKRKIPSEERKNSPICYFSCLDFLMTRSGRVVSFLTHLFSSFLCISLSLSLLLVFLRLFLWFFRGKKKGEYNRGESGGGRTEKHLLAPPFTVG